MSCGLRREVSASPGHLPTSQNPSLLSPPGRGCPSQAPGPCTGKPGNHSSLSLLPRGPGFPQPQVSVAQPPAVSGPFFSCLFKVLLQDSHLQLVSVRVSFPPDMLYTCASQLQQQITWDITGSPRPRFCRSSCSPRIFISNKHLAVSLAT